MWPCRSTAGNGLLKGIDHRKTTLNYGEICKRTECCGVKSFISILIQRVDAISAYGHSLPPTKSDFYKTKYHKISLNEVDHSQMNNKVLRKTKSSDPQNNRRTTKLNVLKS